MRITWKIIADYGLLLILLILGTTLILFVRKIYVELENLNQFLNKLWKSDILNNFLRKR